MSYDKIIKGLSLDEARNLLMQLADDSDEIAAQIEATARPRVEATDWEDIASDLQLELEGVNMAGVFAKSGRTKLRYRSPDEAAIEVLEAIIGRHLNEMKQLESSGLFRLAAACIKGILAGCYGFGHESESEFRQQLDDQILESAGYAFDCWLALSPHQCLITDLHDFLQQECPDYVSPLSKSLQTPPSSLLPT